MASTELPGEERADAPGTLRTLLRYLHAAQLADPRGPSLQDSLATVDRVAEQHLAAMTDRTRWGLAKFSAMTAAEQGVDVQDGAAFQSFADRAQRGEVAYDQQALAAIMERRLTDRALAGAGLAGAAAQGLLGAAEMAALFHGALQERGFRGDEVLADRLRAATGDAAIPLLRPLAVDLKMLGRHATREGKGSELEQWEYEITSGGRVRYLVSPETSTVILVYASPRHPKDTE
ncbi:hypothetical protein AB0O67_18685 [Streptomyces sp. NPDC086077]|uniref:hypothetical protein n=1 Tax=Streptomyces sp. NPDC086077 TaxID=3154862 RepID=UPI003415FA82